PALEKLDDRGEPVGPEDRSFPLDDDVVAEADPEARERARDVRQRTGVEEEQHPAAGLEMARHRVELGGKEVVLRAGDDGGVGVAGGPAGRRAPAGGPVLSPEGARDPAVAVLAAAGHALAVADREREPARPPAQRPQDAADELLLREGRRDRAAS